MTSEPKNLGRRNKSHLLENTPTELHKDPTEVTCQNWAHCPDGRQSQQHYKLTCYQLRFRNSFLRDAYDVIVMAVETVSLKQIPCLPAHKTHFFFSEKCDLNLTCVLCAKGKNYFQTYKYPYSYYTKFLS
jgi:hypothetical protein